MRDGGVELSGWSHCVSIFEIGASLEEIGRPPSLVSHSQHVSYITPAPRRPSRPSFSTRLCPPRRAHHVRRSLPCLWQACPRRRVSYLPHTPDVTARLPAHCSFPAAELTAATSASPKTLHPLPSPPQAAHTHLLSSAPPTTRPHISPRSLPCFHPLSVNLLAPANRLIAFVIPSHLHPIPPHHGLLLTTNTRKTAPHSPSTAQIPTTSTTPSTLIMRTRRSCPLGTLIMPLLLPMHAVLPPPIIVLWSLHYTVAPLPSPP